MEPCPRCTSGLAPEATVCLMCGAPVWRPEPKLETVAVTPAPVALVLPAPVGPGSVVVNLPPQRTESPGTAVSVAPPPPPRPTVLPAAAPAHRATNPFAVAGGAFAALLVVVVLVVALQAHGAKSGQPSPASGRAAVRLDLRHLAIAEETALTATMRYTTDLAALEGVGYMPMPGAAATVLAGIHGKTGYCLVAARHGLSPWYLYDSKQGGLISTGFASEAAAEQACADRAIASYATLA